LFGLPKTPIRAERALLQLKIHPRTPERQTRPPQDENAKLKINDETAKLKIHDEDAKLKIHDETKNDVQRSCAWQRSDGPMKRHSGRPR
jgi:hypothetical protein